MNETAAITLKDGTLCFITAKGLISPRESILTIVNNGSVVDIVGEAALYDLTQLLVSWRASEASKTD